MWIWREDRWDVGGGRFDRPVTDTGGWYVDPTGSWAWSEPERARAEPAYEYGWNGSTWTAVETPARGNAVPAVALLPAAEAGSRPDETPIFRAVSDAHSRGEGLRPVDGASWAAIPEPHPGSGPLPVPAWARTDQDGERRLAAVPTVPPPSMAGEPEAYAPDPGAPDSGAPDPGAPGSGSSAEDELRRRAERRRRPRTEEQVAPRSGGRHALRAEEPVSGRHALG